MTITDGRFSHNDIGDITVCQGRAVSVWASGRITVFPDSTLSLQTGMQTEAQAFSARRLLCLDQDEQMGSVVVPAGTYAQGTGGFWSFTGSRWQPVRSDMNARLKIYLARTPVYSKDALRLRPGSGTAPSCSSSEQSPAPGSLFHGTWTVWQSTNGAP